MYRKQKRLKKRKNRKETAKEMMDRIAKRAEIEEAENIKAAKKQLPPGNKRVWQHWESN